MKFTNWLKWKYSPPLVVLISGKARHGKDTFGEYLSMELESNFSLTTQKLSFANTLKDMTNYPTRDFLQTLGLFLRATRGKDYLIKKAVSKYNGADVIIITDCRYPNEISYFENILGLNTLTFRVSRLDENGSYKSNLTEKQKKHPSETALDDVTFDFYIEEPNIVKLKKEARKKAITCFDAWRRGYRLDTTNSYHGNT